MSDSYERSYYEIALTNSQVLSALAVLLLCLLGAFVGGMWVARGSSPVASTEVVASPATEAEAEEAGEFEFFGESAAGSEEPPRRADRPRQTVTPVQVAEAEPQASSEPVQTLQAPAPSRSAPERRTAAPTPSAPPPQTAAADDSADTASNDDQQLASLYVIQVLSSNDQGQAAKTMARLQESGYRAFISPTEVEGRRMYRVRVGPYADRAQAASAEEKIKRQFRLDTWITSST